MTDLIGKIIEARKGLSRESSPEEWRRYFFEDRSRQTDVEFEGSDGKQYSSSDWIQGKEIKVHVIGDIASHLVNPAVAGIKSLIAEVRLDFRVTNGSYHSDQIDNVTSSDGYIDFEALRAEVISEPARRSLDGKQHADFFVTDRFLKMPHFFGQATFWGGYAVLALPRQRQSSPLNFIYRLARHETGHLLGFGEHHDNSITSVNDYLKARDCNMLPSVPTDQLCSKCSDALISFWKGIEARTGHTYFKRLFEDIEVC